MIRVDLSEAEASALVDRLTLVKALREAPRSEREWLVAHGQLRRYDTDEVVAPRTRQAEVLAVVLSGRIVVWFDHGTGRRHAMETRTGGVTGVLPYSRLGKPLGDAVATEPCEVLAVDRDRIPDLIRECPVITTALVHLMIDRARSFTATNWQDEKVASLGRLAAGVAHEINNPASAAARGARVLHEALDDLGRAAHDAGLAGIAREHLDSVQALTRRVPGHPAEEAGDPLQRAGREDSLAAWLAGRGLDESMAPDLVDCGLDHDSLLELPAAVPPGALPAVLRWVAASASAHAVVRDVERATARITDLVSAVARFTFMDRTAARVPTDVCSGLTDTATVLAGKARARGVSLALELAPSLPPVLAGVAELNQVWSVLIDNAIDAAAPPGEVRIVAAPDGEAVKVCVIDNGPGIPTELQARIFDPFFTTKRVGQGVGLGLDIARRIVQAHNGQIELESRPGCTEFRVRLPRAPA